MLLQTQQPQQVQFASSQSRLRSGVNPLDHSIPPLQDDAEDNDDDDFYGDMSATRLSAVLHLLRVVTRSSLMNRLNSDDDYVNDNDEDGVPFDGVRMNKERKMAAGELEGESLICTTVLQEYEVLS